MSIKAGWRDAPLTLQNFCRSNKYVRSLAWTDNSNFMNQICPKRVFSVKNGKSEHHCWILLIRISLGTKFQLKLTILIFWTNITQKGYFRSKKEKKGEQHHWILHIRLSLGIKFPLKLPTLIFRTKFTPKRYFQLKTKNVNKSSEFYIFELD